MTDGHYNHAAEPHVCQRPLWWFPHLLFGIAAVVMSTAVVLLVVLSLARGRESEIERARDDCEALHDGAVWEATAEHARANSLLLGEIVNQQLAGEFDEEPFAAILRRINQAAQVERAALQDREDFLAASRPVPCTLTHDSPQATTLIPGITIAEPSSSTRPTSTTQPGSLPPVFTTTTLAVAATTIVRPAPTTRPPTPIPTPPPPTNTTTTIDCPGHSQQCNRPGHPPHGGRDR